MNSESKIVSALADRECRRITTSTIRRLQKLKDNNLLSGDDSELANSWDEICVQVQNDRSFFWDAYVITFEQVIEAEVNRLSSEVQTAIWLQTENGYIWDSAEDGQPETIFDDVVSYIVNDYFLEEAGRWSNKRIARFLERSSMRD